MPRLEINQLVSFFLAGVESFFLADSGFDFFVSLEDEVSEELELELFLSSAAAFL